MRPPQMADNHWHQCELQPAYRDSQAEERCQSGGLEMITASSGHHPSTGRALQETQLQQIRLHH